MSGCFDKYYQKYDAWYARHKFAFLSEVKAIKQALPLRGKGVEIGVGTGRFAAALGITTGIDTSAGMLKLAQKRVWNLLRCSGENMPFLDKTFDYAVFIITLCFMKNPVKALKEACRILKPNGKIIIGIIDKESFLGKYYRKKNSIFYKQAKFLSVHRITRLLKQEGFCSFAYFQTIFAPLDDLKSIEEPRKGFGKGGFAVISAKKLPAK